ncbi:MAG: CHASE2 domain-containing protein [Burkholderiales bacterium]|nr:CHASE2 domain-containing protein [Burkholderiales bacterium]
MVSASSPGQWLRSRLVREWLLIVAILAMLGVASARGQWLWRLDQSLYDIALTLWERPAAQDIVLVAIDDASLESIGRWPWRRAIHATLVERIAADRPRALGLDIILSEPDIAERNADALLADKLRGSGVVVLPLVIESGAGAAREVPPIPVLAAAATRQGLIGLELDQDGLARSVYLREGVGVARHSQLALALLEAAGARSMTAALPGEADALAASRLTRSRVRDHWYQVPFVGPPGSYAQVSYADVLAGQVPAGFFRDKFVLVGATATGMGDAFPTPVSGGSRPLPGVEIHANVLQALSEGIDIRLAGPVRGAWLAFIAVLIVMALYVRLTPRQGLVLTGVAALTLAVGAAVVFRYGQVWFAPSSALLVVFSAYPLWSWRRLEAAQGYLAEEFERLSAEPVLLPTEAESYRVKSAGALALGESVEARIQSVREATERLRNLKRFVTDALDSLPDATAVVDRHGAVVLANIRMARLAGVSSPAELAGRPVTALLTGVELKTRGGWQPVVDALAAGLPLAHEAMLHAAGGTEREHLVQTAPCHAASGERIGGILTLIDISALKETERKRDEALRFLSHDMRAPQASILTLLEMHATEPAAMPVARLTERVGRYARRTLTLADDFLRLARAERLRSTELAPVDLVALLDEVRDEALPQAAPRGTRIELDVGADTEAMVNGDGDLLRRAVMNLLSNAIKYSPHGSVVRLGLAGAPAGRAAQGSGEWSVFVADQGHGIAEADLPRLFGRFTRLQREGQPEAEGIGLGLVFVKTVAERHGGRVDVHSRTEPQGQRGSTFTLILPAL